MKFRHRIFDRLRHLRDFTVGSFYQNLKQNFSNNLLMKLSIKWKGMPQVSNKSRKSIIAGK